MGEVMENGTVAEENYVWLSNLNSLLVTAPLTVSAAAAYGQNLMIHFSRERLSDSLS
jgi:hypothetical protein